jgi:hypothetical protein
VTGTAVTGTVTIANLGSRTETVTAIKAALEVRFPSDYTPPPLPSGSTSGWYVIVGKSLAVPAPIGAGGSVAIPYSMDTCGSGAASFAGAKDMRTAATVSLKSGQVGSRSPNYPLPAKCPVCGNFILESGEQCDQGYNGGQCCGTNCRFRADGTACTDGNACSNADQCLSGACTGGSPVVCAPSDQCHVAGVCSPSTGLCSNPIKTDGSACTDGNACTLGDACRSGTCRGSSSVTCPALDQCHVGSCDPQSGACVNTAKADGSECIDGDACTLGDSCIGGTCVSGATRDCNDHMSCTDDSCSAATGCAHADAETCVGCDAAECDACGAACDASEAACVEGCWAGFWSCVNGCTSTYCAPFCQVDLGACLGNCPGTDACRADCDTGNGCGPGCTE